MYKDVYMHYVMREWSKDNPKNIKDGTQKNDIKLNCLGFSDSLSAKNIQETKWQIQSLQEISQSIGLKISIEKMDMMLTKSPWERKIKIGEHDIKIVKKFKYLG